MKARISILTLAIFQLIFISPVQAQRILYFPEYGEVWQEKDPEVFEIDAEQLGKAVDFARANEYSGSRDLRQAILKGFEREPYHEILGPTKDRGGPAGLIVKDGYIIAQWGDVQRVDMTFSVTKSFLSTVAGLAADEGLLQVNDSLHRYIWDGKFVDSHNRKITWEHLLNQSSDWSGQLWGGFDWADRPPRKGDIQDWQRRSLHEPGSKFEYNDVRVNLLAFSLLQVWRRPLPVVLKEKIMDPIGASTTWRWYGYDNSFVTIDGISMQSVSGGGHSGGGLFISAEDMARFGVLFLNEGQWKEKQLISKSWITAATEPSPANVQYGYMWWLNINREGRIEALSEDAFHAAGFGGNFIIVEPEENLVVVLRWLEPSTVADFADILMGAFQ